MPFVLLIIAASGLWAQGPPFQIDDPVPVDLHHYEFYIFGSMDGTPVEIDSVGPAFEFNWGALPRVQLHVVAPFGSINPLNNPIYAPSGMGPSAFGFTDMELGVKIAFIKESKYVPQIGTFPMFEIPTGDYDRGLSVGKVWYKVPLWLQKNIGHWLLDGGAGETINPQSQYRNFPYGGFLLKYSFGERLELGGEIFSHGREGSAAPQIESSTMIDIGGYYHFKSRPGQQFLFCYGHSVAGQTETYAYLGMYWTWGGDKKKPGADHTWLQEPGNTPGFRMARW
ncbi:MAG TPA: transporter [Bryobacteraceae bacterium]